MHYTIILKKGEGLFVWIYKNITNKFTSVFSKIKNRFPVIDRNPLLKYSLIPVFLALFVALRYVIKLVVNELAAWSSGFIGEASGFTISERAIVISIAAVFILLRVGLKLRNPKKKMTN